MRPKRNVVPTQDMLSKFFPGSIVQWVANNVDDQVRTLDGNGTFHGMGIIEMFTPTTLFVHCCTKKKY